jgi:hypothetical protein
MATEIGRITPVPSPILGRSRFAVCLLSFNDVFCLFTHYHNKELPMSYTLTTYGGTSVQVVTPSTGLSDAGAALNDNFEFLVDHSFLPGASVSDGSGNSVTVCNDTWAILAYCANNGVYISAAATITPLQCYCNTEDGTGGSAGYFTDDMGNVVGLCTGLNGLQVSGSSNLDDGAITTNGSGALTASGKIRGKLSNSGTVSGTPTGGGSGDILIDNSAFKLWIKFGSTWKSTTLS